MGTMQALLETTKDSLPKHVYILDGSKLVAYIRAGTTEPFVFKKPMSFDKRYRTFREVKIPKIVGFQSNVRTVRVAGSKGNVYEVTLGTKPTCSCPGFNFRGQCKHIDQAKEQ